MKAWIAPLGLLAVLSAGSCVSADDRPQADYARYVKAGVQAETARFHPDYPSEKEVLVGLLPRVVTDMNPAGYFVRQRPYVAEGLLDRPVVVRVFSSVTTSDRVLYYYCVPLVHPRWGVVDVYTYGRWYDRRKGAYLFTMGQHGGLGGSPSTFALHMMRAEEVKGLAEERLGIRVSRTPMAVCVGVRNLQTRAPSNGDWFWYVRSDSGFERDGRIIRSVFVYPFCPVADPNSVTMEERARDQGMVANVFIRSRFYTYEGEDVDLYALEQAQREAGDAPVSFVPGDRLYMPERISFVPIRLSDLAEPEE